MNAARAKEAIDKAADEAMCGLFNNLRINEHGEDRNKAIEQFKNGVESLLQDITEAKAIIDKVFPLV